MALSFDPESKDYGNVSSPPNITVKIEDSDNLEIRGTARIIDGESHSVKTEEFTSKGKYTYSPNFVDKWDSMAEGESKVELSVTSYEEAKEEPIYADKNNLYLEKTSFNYDGASKIPVLHGYDSSKMYAFGDTSGITPGSYTMRVRPLEGYYWAMPQQDVGQYGDLKFDWQIIKGESWGTVTGPNVSQVVYNGGSVFITMKTEQTATYYITAPGGAVPKLSSTEPGIDRYLDVKVASNAVTLTSKSTNLSEISNLHFVVLIPETDTTTAAKINFYVTIVMDKKISTVPYQTGTLYENGSYQSPTWSNYNTNDLTISGQTYGMNVGSYTAYFTPTTGRRWYDGTTGSKSAIWTIEAEPYVPPVYISQFELEPNQITINGGRVTIRVWNHSGDRVQARIQGEPAGPWIYSPDQSYQGTVNIAPYDYETFEIGAGTLWGGVSKTVSVEFYKDSYYSWDYLETKYISVYCA